MKRFLNKSKTLLKISIFKTIRINLHYFGLKGIFKPSILVSRNTVLKSIAGEVNSSDDSRLLLGFCNDRPSFATRKCYYVNNGGTLILNGKSSFSVGSSLTLEVGGY